MTFVMPEEYGNTTRGTTTPACNSICSQGIATAQGIYCLSESAFGCAPNLSDAVGKYNNDVGGRLVEFTGREYMVRGRGYIRSLDDIRKTVIMANAQTGTPALVGDAATCDIRTRHAKRRRGTGWQGRSCWWRGHHALGRECAEGDRTYKEETTRPEVHAANGCQVGDDL